MVGAEPLFVKPLSLGRHHRNSATYNRQMERTPRQRTGEIDARLRSEYGPRTWKSSGDPVGELVATILSQNTSDLNSMRAFASLRNAFPTWDDVIEAPVSLVAEASRSGGLANIKAPRIQNVLSNLFAEFP
ncbi:MAG: endonuclease III, partial [Thermomicrobiales bacterium]